VTKPALILPDLTSFSTLATDQREINSGSMKMRSVTLKPVISRSYVLEIFIDVVVYDLNCLETILLAMLVTSLFLARNKFINDCSLYLVSI
jgi:hypothetical protein